MVINLKSGTSDYFERTETLMRYYEDIRRYKVLTAEEEQECFYLLHNGTQYQKDKARRQLINSNQRFVVAIAKKFGTNNNLLDLINEGNIGLIEAINKFDTSKGVKFVTFAVWYIRRAINLYNVAYGKIVNQSNQARTYHVISQARNKFLQKENRQPTIDELKEILQNDYNINIKENIDMIDTYFVSIDDNSEAAADNPSLYEFQRLNSNLNDIEKVNSNEFNKTLVTSLLNKLSTRDQDIICMLYGIGYDREYTLCEIAEKKGLTSERVRQLKISIIEKLKLEYKNRIQRI